MNFDPTIGLGSLITLGVLFIGGLGAWFTLKADTKAVTGHVNELDAGHDKLTDKLTALELSVARDCVKRDDLKEVEARLGKRLDDVEHTVRNSTAKMAGELKDMIRDVLPRREGTR